MKTIHHALFLSPLLFVLGCAATGDDTQESISQTDDSLSARTTVVGHTCNVLGGDGSREGVHCADLAFVQNTTGWEMWGVGESLCQPSGGGTEEQCAGIRQNVGLFSASGQLAGAQHNCGRFGGSACPATVRFQNTSGHKQVAFPPSGTCLQIWAALVNDEIVLPVSAKTVGPSPNVASAHMVFCGP